MLIVTKTWCEFTRTHVPMHQQPPRLSQSEAILDCSHKPAFTYTKHSVYSCLHCDNSMCFDHIFGQKPNSQLADFANYNPGKSSAHLSRLTVFQPSLLALFAWRCDSAGHDIAPVGTGLQFFSCPGVGLYCCSWSQRWTSVLYVRTGFSQL